MNSESEVSKWKFSFFKIAPEEVLNLRKDLSLVKSKFNENDYDKFFKSVVKSIADIDFTELNIILAEEYKPTVSVYITYGIDKLFDAWTITDKLETKIYFNAEGFDYIFQAEDRLIIIHELVHFITEKKLPLIPEKDYLGNYHRIMIDEGLAHFLSFPHRYKLLDFQNHYQEKYDWAEKMFFKIQKTLFSTEISDNVKEKLLVEGNTGPYWKKHASIYGLFYFSKIFKENGLTGCIDRLNLFSKKPNLKSFYSDDLHDYPEIPSQIEKFIDLEERKIDFLEQLARHKKISQIAVYYRQLRNYRKANDLFKIASIFFKKTDLKMDLINNIRWADVFRFEKKFEEAHDLLNKVESVLALNQFTEYQDFYFQHLGKLYFDKGDYELALHNFEKAFSIRVKKQNAELISSTSFAIKSTKQKLDFYD